jgi:hypothetical protein
LSQKVPKNYLKTKKDRGELICVKKAITNAHSAYVNQSLGSKMSKLVKKVRFAALITLVTSTSIMLGNIHQANALPRRVTYKISDLTEQDARNFCESKGLRPGGTQLLRNEDRVICRSATRNELETEQITIGIPPSVTFTPGGKLREETYDVDKVCQNKHPNIGAFAGDGGYSCYDSYWQW